MDPLAPPPRREEPPARARRPLRASGPVRVEPGAARSLWLGLLAFVGAGALVVVAAELTQRVLGP